MYTHHHIFILQRGPWMPLHENITGTLFGKMLIGCLTKPIVIYHCELVAVLLAGSMIDDLELVGLSSYKTCRAVSYALYPAP
jgi:hypothetical protein